MPLSRSLRRWSILFALCLPGALAVGLLLLWLGLPAAAQSSGPIGDEEGQTVFTRDDGLVANSVTALLRDDRYLWVGTTVGLSRYTLKGREAGLAWQTFTSDDGMAADAISDLWTDDAGNVWVAHPDGQISLFDGRAWTTYVSPTQTLESAYQQIVDQNASSPWWAVEQGGRVWTLSGGTVGYYVGAVWRPYGQDAGIPRDPLVAVWTGGDGAWVASESGQVGYFDGVNWITFRNVFEAVQRQYDVIAGSGPAVGPLWVVDQEGGVWVRNAFNQRNPRPDVRRFAEGQWTNFDSGDGLADGFVAELRLDQYGRVWARHLADENGQGGGLSFYADPAGSAGGDENWTAILPALTGNVTDFWPEGTDGVWIASYYQPQAGGVSIGGLTYVALNTWQRFSLVTLEGAAVAGTWLDENDALWLGLTADARGRGGGLWRYQPPQGVKPGNWVPVKGLLEGGVRDLWGDGKGNLWVAAAAGVNRITLQDRKRFSYTLPIAPDQIAGDAQGNVWAVALGQDGGVWQRKGNVWASHTVSEGLSGGAYADMLVASDGHVYLAGDRGLDIWDGDGWKTFAALPGRHVKRVWQDEVGDLWLSSEITPGRPFNLSLNRGEKWETVLNEAGSRPMGPEPLTLARDSRGQVWLGTPLGLFVYEPDGDAQWRGLGPVEGIPAGAVPAIYQDAGKTVWVAVGDLVYRGDGGEWRRFEPQVGIVSHIAAGPDRSVLFAGDAGVALYRPILPDLRLEGVVNLITGEVADGREPVVLTIGRNAIRIDLTVVAPKQTARQLSYRYRLQGLEDWRTSPALALGGKQPSIVYAGLPAGVYTFTVAARTPTLDYGPEASFVLYVLSRPPELFLDTVSVAGRPVAQPGALRAYVGQPIQIQLSGNDDQPQSVLYRYRVEGLGDGWTETTQSVLSFTLPEVGIYTFTAMALDDEGQSSPPIGSQIVVSEREKFGRSSPLPVGTIAAGLGIAAAFLIGVAILTMLRRRRRESW